MKYSGHRFVVVGVHTPEYELEKSPDSVSDAVKRFRIESPVAIDSETVASRLYGNQYWPRQTPVDARGRLRWEHAVEGEYDKMQEEIRALLKETGTTVTDR